MIFPRVKNKNLSDHLFPIGDIVIDNASAAEALGLLLPEGKVCYGEGASILCKADPALPEEGYTLRLKAGKVEITHKDYPALVRALATLSLLFIKKDGQMYLPEGEITDAPAFPHRGAMLDIGRGAPPFAEMKQAVMQCAKARLNVLHLHLSDAKGMGIRITSLPQDMILDSAYSRKQIQEIVDMCAALAIEIIPEFDLPAHSTALLSARPELNCQVPISPDERLWCVCAGNEEVYTLYEQIIKEIADWFPHGKYFHIGGDELVFSDVTPPRFCHWEECPRCQKMMKAQGLDGYRELYYHLMNRVNDIVRSVGRQTVMWSEQIDCARPCSLSRDILMQFWRVAYPGRGPIEGCSMQGQLELGYTVINSHYPETYADLEKYMSPETLCSWRPDERPECSDEYKHKISGSELCLWEWGNLEGFPFYPRTTAPSVFLMGDKLWSGIKGAYPAGTGHLLTRAILGAGTPEGFDVFAAVGSLLPPRSEALCYPEKITASKEELKALLSALEDTTRFAGYEHLIAALRPCVQAALQIKN